MKPRATHRRSSFKSGKKHPSWWRWGLAALVVVGVLFLFFKGTDPGFWSAPVKTAPNASLEIQHPIAGAVMPRNMPAPVLLWKTNMPGVNRWAATFIVGRQKWSFDDIQPGWRPTETEWQRLKAAATGKPIELTISGYAPGNRNQTQAWNSVRFVVSAEAVKDPLFYRDVNLPFIEAVKDPSLIRWHFGTLDKGTVPPVVLEKLPVCGNCHSFSRNGEYLAMDVDYANNKGSYVITRTAPEMTMATGDIITWDDFRREDGQETLGLLSQISPDGRYVLSTVKDLSIFMPKPDLAFSQLFFPFMGILGVYDRETKRFSSLPGADDPAFVQSNPTWSPDGQWVVFARNRAVDLKKAHRRGRLLLTQDEDEELFRQTKDFRYDLYRIPFNGGKGGTPEPLLGASKNGRSNYFPKYSPDGRWIVFCQAANYMLLQPDSELFIIPATGGEARRLGCNLSRMNSWHSWSSDGRWLVFTSKAHSDYTQLYLTRIDDKGEASPPVWLAHMVEPKRAANIPEFVALPENAITKIREKFLDDLSYTRAGSEFVKAGETNAAIAKFRVALSLNPDNLMAHQLLGQLLKDPQDRPEAIEHMQAVVRLAPRDPMARFALGSTIASGGDLTNAIVHLEEGVRWLADGQDPSYDGADGKHRLPEALYYRLGLACQRMGNVAGAERHYREVLRRAPDYAEAHYNLGTVLLNSGRIDQAGEHFSETIRLLPKYAEAHNYLGIVRHRQNRKSEAVICFQEAIRHDATDWQKHLNLAFAHLSESNVVKAIPSLQETLRLNPSCKPAQQALAKALGQAKGSR